MIEINLLPEELKLRKERPRLTSLPEVLGYIIPAIFGLLIITHLYLGVLFLLKHQQLKSLQNRCTQLSPQFKEVEALRKQFQISSQQAETAKKLLSQRKTISEKMQALSSNLVSGIWFNQLKIKQKSLYLEASVVSLQKDHMHLVNLFLNRLKGDKLFFKDFIRLDLGQMKTKTVGGFSVVDFVLEVEGQLR